MNHSVFLPRSSHPRFLVARFSLENALLKNMGVLDGQLQIVPWSVRNKLQA